MKRNGKARCVVCGTWTKRPQMRAGIVLCDDCAWLGDTKLIVAISEGDEE